jgi:hypothetical protein
VKEEPSYDPCTLPILDEADTEGCCVPSFCAPYWVPIDARNSQTYREVSQVQLVCSCVSDGMDEDPADHELT